MSQVSSSNARVIGFQNNPKPRHAFGKQTPKFKYTEIKNWRIMH